jgi:hypothetical protein
MAARATSKKFPQLCIQGMYITFGVKQAAQVALAARAASRADCGNCAESKGEHARCRRVQDQATHCARAQNEQSNRTLARAFTFKRKQCWQRKLPGTQTSLATVTTRSVLAEGSRHALRACTKQATTTHTDACTHQQPVAKHKEGRQRTPPASASHAADGRPSPSRHR